MSTRENGVFPNIEELEILGTPSPETARVREMNRLHRRVDTLEASLNQAWDLISSLEKMLRSGDSP